MKTVKTAQLVYSIICDDVRLEMGNKLSLMGLFENIFFQAFPSALLKFAIVNHWIGDGQFETHVKILAPDRKEIVVSVPSKFAIENNGYADNVTFFTNVSFDRSGTHIVQIYIDGNIAAERPLYVHHVPAPPASVN
ncbi:MAG: hypothetical protein AUG08_07700 [Acidobacteria bacterium 13_1_20CM_2_55_15]|nr:MAG: hypothetical protein AUH28_01315 [Acidobacteria bacterium 13_1_40CM_56_16]OLD16651.1 MAG: hypothetical protein AUI91_13730 [Acidobacteria bacterium 13_1_40CM_3_56_11]OLD67347.1 MAG: hypothetical protein AUI45_13840 [Acidobacteria bacterium 13_1_40CM_2_56_11]OLE88617.1 MAG: hypothetical protein AUG08_07700 [Acidobacteria bacterium 13_1_20CM_2_55_15]PYS17168.1 MAG: hypothetical protein DMG17_10670 [Acidobacteriota bacterium]